MSRDPYYTRRSRQNSLWTLAGIAVVGAFVWVASKIASWMFAEDQVVEQAIVMIMAACITTVILAYALHRAARKSPTSQGSPKWWEDRTTQ